MKATKQKKSQNKLVKKLLIITILLFGCLNIYFSQSFSPVLFGLVNNDRKAVVEFLQKIRTTSEFNQQLTHFNNIYGSNLKDAVFSIENERNSKIKQFEQILERSPKSRDILYGLYQLNLEKNKVLTAENYLRLSKQVDPMIK